MKVEALLLTGFLRLLEVGWRSREAGVEPTIVECNSTCRCEFDTLDSSARPLLIPWIVGHLTGLCTGLSLGYCCLQREVRRGSPRRQGRGAIRPPGWQEPGGLVQ